MKLVIQFMNQTAVLHQKNHRFSLGNIFYLTLVIFSLLATDVMARVREDADQDRPQKTTNSQNMSDLQFLGSDAFNQMEETATQMNKSLNEHRKLVGKILKDAKLKHFKSSGDCSSLTLNQDDKTYIYELEYRLFDKDDILVLVKNRNLKISASHAKTPNRHLKPNEYTKFYYFLTLPYDADHTPKIIRDDSKITIKFNKVPAKKHATMKKK